MATTAKTLETSIYWQKHVLANSRDLKQKERAANAIKRLIRRLNELKEMQS